MRIKEISKKLETFINDPSTITWTKFLMESIVSLVLGLAIGFMSVSVISTSIIVSIFVIPLFIYAIILVIYKNKISLLAMLDNELKNRHYENVIILGLQISNTLFNTKQNENRVRIGRKVEEALKSCDRELGEITIDGKILSKEYINVKLNIDDLGWSLYQANKNNWVEAVDTIKKGILSADKMAIDLYSRKDSKCNDYIQMSLKGYRHLVGIFLDKEINKINDGILIEKIIKLIVSKGKIITDENLTDFSNLNITKIETNLISIEKYLNSSNNSDLLTEGFIDTDYLERIIICMNIYNEINPKESSNIINDLYYAFARNNIKIVRINKDTPNKIKLINEAISYSNLYKENETNKKSKKWIRFKSLMNEINIAKASQNNIINTINEIQDTILQCTTRTDLYFRNSTLLVYAITLQYELTVKNNLSLNKSQKRDKIKQLESFISKVRMDIKKIDIVSDIEFENTLKIARKYFKKELTLVKQLAK